MRLIPIIIQTHRCKKWRQKSNLICGPKNQWFIPLETLKAADILPLIYGMKLLFQILKNHHLTNAPKKGRKIFFIHLWLRLILQKAWRHKTTSQEECKDGSRGMHFKTYRFFRSTLWLILMEADNYKKYPLPYEVVQNAKTKQLKRLTSTIENILTWLPAPSVKSWQIL